jgi:hypothetical protein
MLGCRDGRQSSESQLRRPDHILGRRHRPLQGLAVRNTPRSTQQVLERSRTFSPNGGYVFNTIHNVQAHTPVKNIVAMLNAVHEFDGSRAAA